MAPEATGSVHGVPFRGVPMWTAHGYGAWVGLWPRTRRAARGFDEPPGEEPGRPSPAGAHGRAPNGPGQQIIKRISGAEHWPKTIKEERAAKRTPLPRVLP